MPGRINPELTHLGNARLRRILAAGIVVSAFAVPAIASAHVKPDPGRIQGHSFHPDPGRIQGANHIY